MNSSKISLSLAIPIQKHMTRWITGASFGCEVGVHHRRNICLHFLICLFKYHSYFINPLQLKHIHWTWIWSLINSPYINSPSKMFLKGSKKNKIKQNTTKQQIHTTFSNLDFYVLVLLKFARCNIQLGDWALLHPRVNHHKTSHLLAQSNILSLIPSNFWQSIYCKESKTHQE